MKNLQKKHSLTEKKKVTDIKNLVRNAAKKLIYSDAPEVDAYELFEKATSLSANDILLSPLREISEEKLRLFDSYIEKRATGYPLQYILGEWDFFGNTFFVNEGVLIPRCETEQIADECCTFLKMKKNKVVFDLCSGSGCIGLSIAAKNPDCKVYLFDISPFALSCSKKNLEAMGLTNAEILEYDIFSGFDKSKLPFPDVIVSNPPYVTREEFETLQKEIFFEPETAIVCEGDGLDFYRAIAEKWLPYLAEDGFFMLESGEEQPVKITEILENTEAFNTSIYNVMCCDDIFSVERFVKGVGKNAV